MEILLLYFPTLIPRHVLHVNTGPPSNITAQQNTQQLYTHFNLIAPLVKRTLNFPHFQCFAHSAKNEIAL